MAVKLNKRAFEYAKGLVTDGNLVIDEKDDWEEHRPSERQENDFIAENGFDGYAKWHLGIDDDKSELSKEAYEFPIGDFENVHRCAVLYAETRAARYKYTDIADAAAELHGMIDEVKSEDRTFRAH
jgi:hypothetical protein